MSFYQYFASKEDVFGHLAGQVARQVSASTEALDPLTPDAAGWTALRAWVTRYAEIHERYEPIFHALETDEDLSLVARRTGIETVARVHSRLVTTTIPPRQLDLVIRLLLETVNHTLDVRSILASVAPDAYPSGRIEDSITDVVHRALFGLRPKVNVHDRDDGATPPVLDIGSELLDMMRQGTDATDVDRSANRALVALLTSGHDVFVERGYHATRVDDLAIAAGVSHGAFYRYFGSKDQLARILAARAAMTVGAAVLEMPDVSSPPSPGEGGSSVKTALRRWLRRYHVAHASEAAMLQVWMDASLQDPALRTESAPLYDWGRRRMARYLAPRAFGDVEMDAVVMVALLGVFGARARSAAEIDAAAHIIERGLLGR